MCRKLVRQWVLAGLPVILLLVASSANAAIDVSQPITPTSGDTVGPPITRWEIGTPAGNFDYSSLIGDYTEVYKQDVGGGESGALAGSYTTTFAPPTNPNDATITWDGGSFVNTEKIYLLVKDGNATPAQYLFDISNWDGKSTLVLQGFWKDVQGSISHVSIFSQGGPSESEDIIPEPMSLAIWGGLSCLGLVLVRRRRTIAG